jgi:hypothetical protein
VTRYVARRLIAREQALVSSADVSSPKQETPASPPSRGETVLSFILGIIVGAIGLFVLGVYLTR